MKLYSMEVSSLELLREKFKNALEISGRNQGKIREFVSQNVATLFKNFKLFKVMGMSFEVSKKLDFNKR